MNELKSAARGSECYSILDKPGHWTIFVGNILREDRRTTTNDNDVCDTLDVLE